MTFGRFYFMRKKMKVTALRTMQLSTYGYHTYNKQLIDQL